MWCFGIVQYCMYSTRCRHATSAMIGADQRQSDFPDRTRIWHNSTSTHADDHHSQSCIDFTVCFRHSKFMCYFRDGTSASLVDVDLLFVSSHCVRKSYAVLMRERTSSSKVTVKTREEGTVLTLSYGRWLLSETKRCSENVCCF